MDPRILIFDNIDLYALGYAKDLIRIGEERTFGRSKLMPGDYTIELNNIDDFFSADNPKSIFSGVNWLFSPLLVYNADGALVWDGVIRNIERNHETKMATINSVSALYKFQNVKIDYQSADWETPADALKNIMIAIGFTDYDPASLQASADYHASVGCYLKCNFTSEANVTFQSVAEKLGEYGCADCYCHKNKIVYQVYRPFTGGIKVNLKESDLLEAPIVSVVEDEIINEFDIGYYEDGGTQATDAANNNIGATSRAVYGLHDLPEMRSGSDNSQIIFKDKTSALFIGESYIRRTHALLATRARPRQKITTKISIEQKDWIDLNTFFTLSLTDELWMDKVFEIFSTNIDYESGQIEIVAYEVLA